MALDVLVAELELLLVYVLGVWFACAMGGL